MEPKRPANLDEYADLCLKTLAEQGLGRLVSIGGAVGLAHFLDYRRTHDLDAWWRPEATSEQRERILTAVGDALSRSGDVRRRSWGEVVSIELVTNYKVVFSFQVAARTVQLAPPQTAPWIDVFLDSFDDLVASKMVALVERGLPRDFRDIFALCQAGLCSPEHCWDLWRQRQSGARATQEPDRARTAVLTHLEKIVKHRPLESIPDPAERAEASRLRRWFATEFLDALPH